MRFPIAKEGLWYGGIALGLSLICIWTGLWLIAVMLGLVCAGMFFFFRQPYRISSSREDVIYAPADGKIVQIREEHEDSFLRQTVFKISIFMSLLNVHINYAPISGSIDYLQYTPGRFNPADRVPVKETNENNFIGIGNGKQKVAMRQVAGWVARRVVCNCKLGDEVLAGERIGLVKFGSRVDVYFPKHWQVVVKSGQAVRAGRTIIARIIN